MKLYRLRFGGLGPFKSTFDVDFQSLGRSGLFLIEGPTGSGKSTLIDAITFALYGSVAGDESGKGRLVSQFLDSDDAAPFAELTFETSHGIFRVHREPEYDRAKRRGTGVTRSTAKARLFSLTPDEVELDTDDIRTPPLASAPSAVNTQIARIIGLGRAQFTQTIVLPQGEFTTFLRAKAEDRRKLLQILFDTGEYQAIADEFDARRKAAESAFAAASAAMLERATMFAEAAGLDAEQASTVLAAVDDAPALSERLDSHLLELGHIADTTRAASEAATGRCDTARALHQQRVDRLGLVERRRTLDIRQFEFEQRQPEVTLAKEQVRALDQSALPRRLHEQWSTAVGQVGIAARELAVALAADPNLSALTHDELTDSTRALRAEAASLTSLVALEAELAEGESQISELTAELHTLNDERLTLVEALAGYREQLTALDAALLAAQTAAASVDSLRSAHEAVVVQLKAAESVAELDLQLAPDGELSVRLAAATRADRDCEAEYVQVSQSYRAAAAAVLADELVDDQPCPVCGSTTHPIKATPVHGGATVDEVNAAADRASQARAALQSARGDFDSATNRRLALADVARASVSDLRVLVDEAAAELAAAEAAHSQVSEVRGERDRLQATAASTDEQLATNQQAIAAVTATTVAHQRQREAQMSTVLAAREQFDSVSARVDFLTLTADNVEAVAHAVSTHDGAVRHEVESRATLDQSLAEVSLADADDFARLIALAPQRDQLSAMVAAHEAEGGALAELRRELGHVDPAEVVDVEEAAVALAAAQAEADLAAARQHSAEEAVARASRRAEEARRALEHLVQMRADSAELIALAGVVTGAGALNVSLPLFAVTRRFTEVVDVANERLRVMLDGRLTLEAHDDQLDRRSKFGLGLRVIDRDSGLSRDTSTLSGGEGFCCALALALALAEVVAAEQGALRTDALFIDEGFGSLDPATLDDVTIELNRLRGEGRMVGVVSHVTEMKDQIHSQIRVRRTEGGYSELSVVLP